MFLPSKKVPIHSSSQSNELSKLNTEKLPGPDQIHPRMLKEIPIVAAPLKTMFTNSIISQKLPCQWKLANVAPIHKKGKRKLCNNYRPISLTSVVVKILESFVREAIIIHMKKNATFSVNTSMASSQVDQQFSNC